MPATLMPETQAHAIGLDFGTNSCRSLLVNLRTGEEIATAVFDYPSGEAGVVLDPSDANIARQNPRDYIEGTFAIVREALALAAEKDPAFTPQSVIAIGVDTTGSTPIPVDETTAPLSLREEFSTNPNAMAWLWKDHSSATEAAEITRLASEMRPRFLAKCGGTYSSEWFWSKLWRLLKVDPQVFSATASFVELCDFIPALLTGASSPAAIKRSRCAAGHKAMFDPEWGGLPDQEFLTALDPALAAFRAKLYRESHTSDQPAGTLSQEWAAKLGLSEHVVVGIGAFDAHMGAVGSGVEPGTMVKILGTSTCDIMVSPGGENPGDIPGVCGIVQGSVTPDTYGIEAGQSAVGDIFLSFVNHLTPDSYGTTSAEKFAKLGEAAAELRPGESGLLALDWHNGNRTILVDPRLTGLILGQTLHTRPHEIYRALVEATAFGALTIVNRIEEYGVPVERIINCGGLASKNSLLMQIYADVLNRPMHLVSSDQTCALGAALLAAVAAGPERGGYSSIAKGQQTLCRLAETSYHPDPTNHATYRKLHELYITLHDAFGHTGTPATSLHHVMKELLAIQAEVKNS